MPQTSRASVESKALTLLKLAGKIPSDSFPALKSAATTIFSIIETSAKFTSNRQDWANFGRYVETATAAAMQTAGAEDAAGMPSIQTSMEQVFEILENIHRDVDGLQRSHPQGRIRLASKDRKAIADMKTQVDVVLKPTMSGGHRSQLSMKQELNAPKQVLERILQRYRNEVVAGHAVASKPAMLAADPPAPTVSAGDCALVPVIRNTAPISCEPVLIDTSIPAAASKLTDDHFSKPAPVFNISSTYGGHVTNVAGDHTVYGLDEKQLAIKMTLERLAYADGASWDPALACLPGTRLTVLSLIDGWARSRDGQNVFWLHDVAGSGKSAIAHTVAKTLHKTRVLVSSFFLDAAVDSRSTLRSIFSTVARDIAARYPAFAEDISTVLEEDLSLASAPLARQFEELIKKPLLRHAHAITDPIVVVIDAMDEIIQDASDAELLRILRDEASQLPQLRILVTSRPTRVLIDFLSGLDHIQPHHIDITSPENADDIEAFISGKLQDNQMRNKMGPSSTDSATASNLKLLAEGLFIWIVTVFRYLDSVDNPEGKLRLLLSKAGTLGRLNPTKKIDALYAAVLEVSGDWEDPEFCESYGLLMGAIMAAKRPLSLAALGALHGDTQNLVWKRLAHRFGSVLVGLYGDNKPIRTLHLSFQEFITDHANNAQDTRKFYISEKEHSQRLAVLCVQTMVRECKTAPILGTGYLARNVFDPPGIPEVVGVSDQLLYSCESWIDHLVGIKDPDSAIAEGLQVLLSDHGTMWMEIVSSRSIFRGSGVAWQWLKGHALHLKELPSDESREKIMFRLSYRLSSVERYEEAVTALREVVDLRRALAADRPTAFNGRLADALFNMSRSLTALGQSEEAMSVIREVVDLRRALAADQPSVFNGPLADSLNNMSNWLAAAGRHEEAVILIQETVDMRRALAADQPSVFNGPLAVSLSNMSFWLAAAGRHEVAVTAMMEALDLRRALAADRPALFNARLADSLHNMAHWLTPLGRNEEALAASLEAVSMYRALAASQPAAFDARLGNALSDMSDWLAAVGRNEEAVIAIREAVDLSRTLPANPDFKDLADNLESMSNHLTAVGRHEQAAIAIQEAADIRSALAAERLAI